MTSMVESRTLRRMAEVAKPFDEQQLEEEIIHKSVTDGVAVSSPERCVDSMFGPTSKVLTQHQEPVITSIAKRGKS